MPKTASSSSATKITSKSSNALTPRIAPLSAAGRLSGSLGFGLDLDIRRGRPEVRPPARLINLGFQGSCFLNQNGSKLRVGGFLGELEKRRCLTHEIIPNAAPKRDTRAFGSRVPADPVRSACYRLGALRPPYFGSGTSGNAHYVPCLMVGRRKVSCVPLPCKLEADFCPASSSCSISYLMRSLLGQVLDGRSHGTMTALGL